MTRFSESDVEEFLDRERERYRAQLEGYARLMSLGAGQSANGDAQGASRQVIRLGLYFPLLNGWREWRYGGPAS